MKHCFGIAIWMFFFIGYVQAKPVEPLRFKIDDLGFGLLHDEVKCDNNVTFITPTEMTEQFSEALHCFIEGMKHAENNCTDTNNRIGETLESLENQNQNIQTKPSACAVEGNKPSKEEFTQFLIRFESFLQELNLDSSTSS